MDKYIESALALINRYIEVREQEINLNCEKEERLQAQFQHNKTRVESARSTAKVLYGEEIGL